VTSPCPFLLLCTWALPPTRHRNVKTPSPSWAPHFMTKESLMFSNPTPIEPRLFSSAYSLKTKSENIYMYVYVVTLKIVDCVLFSQKLETMRVLQVSIPHVKSHQLIEFLCIWRTCECMRVSGSMCVCVSRDCTVSGLFPETVHCFWPSAPKYQLAPSATIVKDQGHSRGDLFQRPAVGHPKKGSAILLSNRTTQWQDWWIHSGFSVGEILRRYDNIFNAWKNPILTLIVSRRGVVIFPFTVVEIHAENTKRTRTFTMTYPCQCLYWWHSHDAHHAPTQ